MNILFIGDVVGSPGREYLSHNLSKIRRDYSIDFCIANGENSAHGNSITISCANQLYESGVDFITMGNHTFNRDTEQVFDEFRYIIRPANQPKLLPGEGSSVFDTGTCRIGIINVQGQIYMDPINSPFEACNAELRKIKDESDVIIVDFHAEATSEKGAMGHFLDGKVTAVLGTHTHVQTADNQILPNGTAFITDVGMTGVADSILGVNKDIIITRMSEHINKKFELADGKCQFNAVVITTDNNGKAQKIERINYR